MRNKDEYGYMETDNTHYVYSEMPAVPEYRPKPWYIRLRDAFMQWLYQPELNFLDDAFWRDINHVSDRIDNSKDLKDLAICRDQLNALKRYGDNPIVVNQIASMQYEITMKENKIITSK